MAAILAELAGCSPDELVITRNTTESLDMIISGYPWKQGDEAIMAYQDYGSMLLIMFRQVEKRYGVAPGSFPVPNHPASDEEVISVYEKAITPPHPPADGQSYDQHHGADPAGAKNLRYGPCKGSGSDGRRRTQLAHIRHSIPELHCDYYGTSLHKWLSVPLGAGMLFVKPGLAQKIWPLLAEPDESATGIARLNHTGTLPVHTDLAIGDAIDYYTVLGPERKEARLRYLQQYWTSRVRDLPGVVVNTPADPARACGIANVGIKGMKPTDLADRLLSHYKIYTVAIDSPAAGIQGCRITPNLFTMPAELDILVGALKELVK